MATYRKTLPMQTQIEAMRDAGHSIRAVASALNVSRQTVRKYERGTQTEGEKIQREGWDCALNWETISQAKKRGVTTKQLHKEYAPEVKYSRFWRRLREALRSEIEFTIRRTYVAGERVEIDYTDGIDIVNLATGEATKTQLFVGVLPFSSYVFGEFTWTQKLASFISSQEKMFRFFGGVTTYVVPDNLKSAVTRAHRYDPDVNQTYCDFGNHMGFAVLPARPRTPKDKGSVECAIGVIQDNFFQEVRNRIFSNLGELNAAFAEYLGRLNSSHMKDYGTTRDARFSEEKLRLKALPLNEFQMTEWKEVKVHNDCHVQVERNFYSVPFSYASQIVRVKLTANLLEIYSSDATAIAVHTRASGKGKMVTNEAHYPEKKLAIKRFDIEAARRKSRGIGPKTEALVESLVVGDYPLKYLRRIQGILGLLERGTVTKAALEYASGMAAQFQRPRLQYVKSCALHFDAHGEKRILLAPKRDAAFAYLHGENAIAANEEAGAS